MAAEYPKPSVTVDCVVFRYEEHAKKFQPMSAAAPSNGETMQVLLIERAGEPFRGKWALPGGFVEMDESLHNAAARELREETALRDVYLEQLYTFGAPKRDPRGRVISVAYMALLRPGEGNKAMGGSDAKRAEWVDVGEAHGRKLAFDHNIVLRTALLRLQAKVQYAPILFDLLPKKFTIPEAQRVYEAIRGRGSVDARHFRRRLEEMKLLHKAGSVSTGHRPATLYSLRGDLVGSHPADFRLP